MTCRIICIGNRFIAGDSVGPRIYECLQEMNVPAGVEVIEGGLAGLSLLPFLEQGGRVVFVDAVAGFALPGTVVVLDQQDVIASLDDGRYSHAAGLPYLLSVLPRVCDGRLPEEIVLVGVEGAVDASRIREAAELSLFIAMNGYQGTG